MPVSHIERVDDSGVVERFAFFGPDDERLAGTTHIPPGPIAGTVSKLAASNATWSTRLGMVRGFAGWLGGGLVTMLGLGLMLAWLI